LIDSARAHHTGRCRDVSEGGLLVELETELPVGMPVELYFELPTGVALEVRAEVARSANSTLALRFQTLTAADRKALAAYCETWRAALLSRCARIASAALSAATEVASPAAEFEAAEQQSGVRIRIAREWTNADSERKPG
jgi:hypothetical protein